MLVAAVVAEAAEAEEGVGAAAAGVGVATTTVVDTAALAVEGMLEEGGEEGTEEEAATGGELGRPIAVIRLILRNLFRFESVL